MVQQLQELTEVQVDIELEETFISYSVKEKAL